MDLQKENKNNIEFTNDENSRIEKSIETVNLSKEHKENIDNSTETYEKEEVKTQSNETTFQKIESAVNNFDSKVSNLGDKLSEAVTSSGDKLGKTLEKPNQAFSNLDETISNKTDNWFNGNNQNMNNSYTQNMNNNINQNMCNHNKIDSGIMILAVVLNLLFPGLGNIIIGQVMKGVILMVSDVVGIIIVALLTCGIGALPFQIILTVIVCLDVYNCATAINEGKQVGDMQFIIFKN